VDYHSAISRARRYDICQWRYERPDRQSDTYSFVVFQHVVPILPCGFVCVFAFAFVFAFVFVFEYFVVMVMMVVLVAAFVVAFVVVPLSCFLPWLATGYTNYCTLSPA